MRPRLLLIIIFLLSANFLSAAEFRLIDTAGTLAFGEFPLSVRGAGGEARLFVLKLDPRFYDLALLSRSEYGTGLLSPQQWCAKFEYELCFNAGMFAADSLTTVGYCKNYGHVIYPRLNRHKAVLAFNPRNDSVAVAKIINRGCEDFDSYKSHYNTFLQSLRMLDCDGRGTWEKGDKRHSILAIAEDSLANIYILFSQYPLSVPDFIGQALGLLPDLKNMMYLEGGSAACLYANLPGLNKDLCGTAGEIWPPLFSSSQNVRLPNVIAVRIKRH